MVMGYEVLPKSLPSHQNTGLTTLVSEITLSAGQFQKAEVPVFVC